ncbi:flocculation protein FLO11 [Oryzias melastigma]|uniref:flocculation protein FLO11 n=1 Tax=Oryzias melastigma TaxID=30732 RepID=UPI000CF7FCF4|nr:flocculation protein FLO11 [Oryzias melastigma]
MTVLHCLFILSGLTVASPLGLEEVFFSPQNQTVREGGAVFLQCVSGESSSPAEIFWLKDGGVVTRGRHFQGEYGGGQQNKTSGTLHLSNVTPRDDGIYVCVTRNPLLNISRKSKPAKLTVQRVPRKLQITQGPDNTTVAMGTNVSMQCSVSGFPVPMVRWFKDGLLLPDRSASFSLQNNGQLLTFRNVTQKDEGFYHCEASDQNQTVQSEPAFLLPAEMGWTFVQEPSNTTVKRGENLTLTCSPPHSRPDARVTWFRNDQLLLPSGRITARPNGDLFFLSVQDSDGGSYFCRASNVHLHRVITSTRAAVTVLSPPTVTLRPQVLTVAEGAQAVLECEVSGHPSPSISWVKRGHSKQTGGRMVLGRRNASLHIQSARSYDEAEYLCEASNVVGRSRSTALLRVAVSPVIVTHSDQVVCRAGARAILPCKAVGVLPITYRWTKVRAGVQISISFTEDRYVSDGDLHISRVQHSDAGQYYCEAENPAGRHQRRTVLAVTGSGSNNSTTSLTFPRKPVSELKIPPEPHQVLQQHLNQQATNPTQVLVTQIQPPMVPPPPHPHFQSAELHTPQTSDRPSSSGAPVIPSEVRDSIPFIDGQTSTSGNAEKPQKVPQELFLRSYTAGSHTSDESSPNPAGPNSDSLNPTSTQSSGTQSWMRPSELSSEPQSPQLVTFSHLSQPTEAPPPSSSPLTLPRPSFTINVLPKFHLELPTLPSFLPPSTLEHGSSPQQRPLPPSSAPQHNDKVLHQSNRSVPLNQTEKPRSDKEPADSRSKRNTSRPPVILSDPKGTQPPPSWLPVLEKHDIPVVVGVGVSLAFIFITVTFYSVVQKNEPAQTGRAAQRNFGIPVRHADCRAAGRTYENRAFEDDDCVAVIEQSPNTSDTRTRPPGPCLVTVQMEPTFQELSENDRPLLENTSVTVETYPEPVADTEVDSSVEEEKGCTLQSAEDWTGSRGDIPSLCQETLPPPSSFPSPSPPSRREEALHSSLTLQSAELSVAPIQHSLSVSGGSPPLLLSHHVSLGLTTVAVDVQFYPAATAPVAVGASTRINSASNSTPATVPLFSPSLVNSQEEDDPSASKFPARK